MDHGIHLGKLVAFVLVDHEDVSGLDGIKFLVDQKLPAAGNGIVYLVAVVDMHIHSFFFLI